MKGWLIVNTVLQSLQLQSADQARTLGEVMESDLNFEKHIKTVTMSAYSQLMNVSRLKRLVSQQDLEKLVHAFIFSRLTYCSSVFTDVTKKAIRQLQLTQNSVVQFLTKTNSESHHSSSTRSLHCLPIRHGIDLKVLLLVYKALNGLRPKTPQWPPDSVWNSKINQVIRIRSFISSQSKYQTWRRCVQLLCSTYLEQTSRKLQISWNAQHV